MTVYAAFEVREVQVFALCANTQFTQLVEVYALTQSIVHFHRTNPGCAMSNCN